MSENATFWNILLIDGSEEDYLLLKAILQEMKGDDFALIWYRENVLPIKLVCSGLYDVVFTEYQYGAINGLELIQAVHAECPDSIVIMLTDWDIPSLEQTALGSGAFAFLKKETLTSKNLYWTLQKKINGNR